MIESAPRPSSRSHRRSKKPGGGRVALVATVLGGVALAALLPMLREQIHPPIVASPASTSSGADSLDALPHGSHTDEPAGLAASDIHDRDPVPLEGVGSFSDSDQDEIRDIRTFTELPWGDAAVMAAHDSARFRCEFIPPGEPFEYQGYQPFLLRRDATRGDGHATSLSTRRHAFSVGLGVLNSDRAKLPAMSRGQILNYLDEWRLSFQFRVQQDPITEAAYLHHRPLACLVGYGNADVTGTPTDGIRESLQNYRSLGLFNPKGKMPTPRNLRTLVILHRGERAEDEAAVDRQAVYEYVFVRARENRAGALELHPFGTSGGRTTIHYLRTAERPDQSGDCSLKWWIYFTSFTHAGLYPADSVTRTTTVNARSTFPAEALEQYAKSQDWEGDAWANLPRTLDAIIDGRIAADEWHDAAATPSQPD